MSMRYGPVDLTVPSGFQNILHLISREVLRVTPSSPLEFIATFVDDLLAIREQSGYDPVAQGEMMERVQEQYWKVQMERTNSKVTSEAAIKESNANKSDGSGNVGSPVSLATNAEGTRQDLVQDQAQEASQPHPFPEEEGGVAEQPELTGEQREAGVEGTIDAEGEQVGIPEGEEEGMKSVTIETEEHTDTQLEDKTEQEEDE